MFVFVLCAVKVLAFPVQYDTGNLGMELVDLLHTNFPIMPGNGPCFNEMKLWYKNQIDARDI